MSLHYLIESLPHFATRFLELSKAWCRFPNMVSPPLGPVRRVGSGVVERVIRIARGSVGVAHSADKV